jgi:peptide/nickel transport system permease protein
MIEALRERMGLDQPVWMQFSNSVTSALRGDLGTEALSGRPVLTVVLEQLPFTLALVTCGSSGPWLLGVPLGCIAACSAAASSIGSSVSCPSR